MAEPLFAFWLKNLSNAVKKRIDWLSKDTELTGFQRYVMGYLIEVRANDDVYQKDLEKHLKISRASVTSILQLLDKNGFVERIAVPQDARLKKIVVTEKGRAAHTENTAIIAQVEKELREGISAEDLAVFERVMIAMTKNLDTLNGTVREKEVTDDISKEE